jgi:hypothetical protein
MIEPNRIAAGVARNLLKRAGTGTDPNPLIEEAFRRGFSAWPIDASPPGPSHARPARDEPPMR